MSRGRPSTLARLSALGLAPSIMGPLERALDEADDAPGLSDVARAWRRAAAFEAAWESLRRLAGRGGLVSRGETCALFAAAVHADVVARKLERVLYVKHAERAARQSKGAAA